MQDDKDLTIDDIRRTVAHIDTIKRDFEAAHGAEDDLHVAVLRQIAKGKGKSAELAREALKTTEISFSRYCA